ncbi:MAG: ribonuclease Z [Acidobacteriota bacterium]
MDQIRVLPLGISAGAPTSTRHVSATAVVLDGETILIDCGEGTQYQLMRSSLRTGGCGVILISHLHGDHLYGLPGLLGTMALYDRSEPLAIFGPAGLCAYLDGVRKTTQLNLPYPVSLTEAEPGIILEGKGFRIIASALEHSIPTLGYTIVEDDRPGTFDARRATALGVTTGPLFGHLKRGERVTLSDGRTVHGTDLVGPVRAGRRVTYCCDTRRCDSAVELARGADLLIHESTYGEDMRDEAGRRWHSTAVDAAHVAAQAGARKLLLTHISPRYTDSSVLQREAMEHFTDVEVAEELRWVEL